MIYDLSFLPEVEDDVIAGYSWYEEKAKGLAYIPHIRSKQIDILSEQIEARSQ